jgi:hypothetical protein
MRWFLFLGTVGLLVGGLPGAAGDPCKSGPQAGQRPGPYAAVQATGAHRGQSYCYVCETADKPAVVVFARSLNDALAKLLGQIDKAVPVYKAAGLRAWVTFLSNDQPSLDEKIVKWGQEHAIRTIPLGVFEDPGGPPSYRLARDADVTVLLYVQQQVVANFAFRSGELSDERIAEVIQSLARIAKKG